ncbi:ceramide transfer protein isoform X2 [Frankliniella occidentalis]|uniref:Ceramide transfer protein n=1 Tax=Frankliniella occidentalis TaxID=133901 RepID=A0A9C6XAK3_FRAOC|nr:ceramide transfer protein isoform X2 [Frankliniella occidentalis]
MEKVPERPVAEEQAVASDEEDDSENGLDNHEWQGVLSKWTNYIHGWQARYVVLKGGTLSYYKSKKDMKLGCRGSISLFKATIKAHEFDESRFDVSVNDSVWYLRAATPEDKVHWVDLLETYKAESGYGSENSLKRHGSAVSLSSNTLSTASTNSLKKARGLKEKLSELETFRDILCGQIDTLQTYFDECAQTANGNEQSCANSGTVIQSRAVDFKGEAMTFKATTTGVLTTLEHCLEMVRQSEDLWKRRLEKEVERRRRLEESLRTLRVHGPRSAVHAGPDCEARPHSTMNEDEFYDAMETGLDKMEEEVEYRHRLKKQHSVIAASSTTNNTVASAHHLWPEIDRVTMEQMHYARMSVEDSGGVWQLFAEEGEMKMYRREEEVGGMVIDPLRACHVVKGVTGHEVCEYFFNPQYRLEWEATVETTTVLEKIADDILLFLQVHKRIWPASQRDAVFWSHMRHVPDDKDQDGPPIWVVVNNSVDIPDLPANTGKCVRLLLTVCLMCQTFIDPPKDGAKVTRNDLTCKITYCSVVNPGGWAPPAVLRAVYKREYPKFLKRFTNYVIDQCQDKPILF